MKQTVADPNKLTHQQYYTLITIASRKEGIASWDLATYSNVLERLRKAELIDSVEHKWNVTEKGIRAIKNHVITIIDKKRTRKIHGKKLTDREVRIIRSAAKRSDYDAYNLSMRFNVSEETIRRVVRWETYKCASS